jgi:hypothetical protein
MVGVSDSACTAVLYVVWRGQSNIVEILTSVTSQLPWSVCSPGHFQLPHPAQKPIFRE